MALKKSKEFIDSLGKSARPYHKMIKVCDMIIDDFLNSEDEAWELQDKDFGRKKGWLHERKDNHNCAYAKTSLKSRLEKRNILDVKVLNINGHVYLVREDM